MMREEGDHKQAEMGEEGKTSSPRGNMSVKNMTVTDVSLSVPVGPQDPSTDPLLSINNPCQLSFPDFS